MPVAIAVSGLRTPNTHPNTDTSTTFKTQPSLVPTTLTARHSLPAPQTHPQPTNHQPPHNHQPASHVHHRTPPHPRRPSPRNNNLARPRRRHRLNQPHHHARPVHNATVHLPPAVDAALRARRRHRPAPRRPLDRVLPLPRVLRVGLDGCIRDGGGRDAGDRAVYAAVHDGHESEVGSSCEDGGCGREGRGRAAGGE